MKLSDFVIGEDFLTAIGPWRCTDIGSRTITAVRWPDPRQAPREHAQRELWLAGPPYVLPEVVFDEKEMALAYRSQEEAIARAMEDRDHPGFDGDDVERLFSRALDRSSTPFEETYREPLLRFDRVKGDEVFHPYDWEETAPSPELPSGCRILVLGLFTREFRSFFLEDWQRLPISTPQEMSRVAALYPHRRLWSDG